MRGSGLVTIIVSSYFVMVPNVLGCLKDGAEFKVELDGGPRRDTCADHYRYNEHGPFEVLSAQRDGGFEGCCSGSAKVIREIGTCTKVSNGKKEFWQYSQLRKCLSSSDVAKIQSDAERIKSPAKTGR